MNNSTLNLEKRGFRKVDSIGILSGKNKPFLNISRGVQFEDYISHAVQNLCIHLKINVYE